MVNSIAWYAGGNQPGSWICRKILEGWDVQHNDWGHEHRHVPPGGQSVAVRTPSGTGVAKWGSMS